tara:strand:- start:107 stop:2965 length:2859 start_codon:yes stop_codon:yes gene_type:complete
MKIKLYNIILSSIFCSALAAEVLMKPSSYSSELYKEKILDGNYIAAIDHPNTFLDFNYGDRVANHSQISSAVLHWSKQSDKIKVIEYAKSHEGRPLYVAFISSSKNLKNLDEIKNQITKLSDARITTNGEANSIIENIPAVAWMAYSIHGNETSGADAALGIIYHLISSTDLEITKMLEDMVVIVDPMMNPDGRDRFAKSLEQYRGTAPNYDDQSLIHTGDWPYGRTNHYYFDLNRDWFYLTQPETQGRVKLINQWRPQILVDGHEMGAQDTFMTGPPREPINKNIDRDLIKWGNIFAQDQAEAFDKKNWRFYTGEWHEDLYPGYSFYAQFRGSLGILYEQSRMAEDGVRRPEGTIQSYKESVHHQFVSTLANLKTLEVNSKAMYQDYWDARKYNVSKNSKYANQTYVILPTKNNGRLNALAEKLQAQDIELFTNERSIIVKSATTQSGENITNYVVPKGSLVIPNQQPEAPLISAILEFDADIDKSVLIEERQESLRDGSSIMYDTTAFNFSMMFGLKAITVNEKISNNLEKWVAESSQSEINKDSIIWATDGEDDRSVAFAARLMEQNIQVRIIDKESFLSGHELSRGSVAVLQMDNPNIDDLSSKISQIKSDLGISIVSIESGFGPELLPDWGGRHFRLLEKPQVAILGHSSFNSYDVGVSWWSLDHHLGIRHSLLNGSFAGYADLRRYNVIIMPSGYLEMSDYEINALNDWIKQGGTLIAHNSSSRFIASNETIGGVMQLQDVLDKSNDYNFDLLREIYALEEDLNQEAVLNNTLDLEINYPLELNKTNYSEDELKNRDRWQSIFMPSGAFVAGRTDQKHWLTFGTPKTLPLLYGNYPILMTDDNAEAPIRIGELVDNPVINEFRSINWSTLPAGKDIKVRMSGLIWPEAAQRIANSAYLTRERVGKGQIILFAGEPNFRGSTRGTNRVWLNAIVYGPGLGTSPKIEL